MDLQKTITAYVSDYYGWLDVYTTFVVVEFDKFMELVALKQIQLTGPEDIEKCWQALVLDTELYTKYCLGRFGKFIHYKIPKLDFQTRQTNISNTIKIYLEKYGRIENKIVWNLPVKISSGFFHHDIKNEITINGYSKSGTKYFVLTHKFNSCDNFGYIKELVGYTYNLDVSKIKIFICKLGLPNYIIANIQEFYSWGSILEVPEKTNVSGLFGFGVKTFDLVIH